MIQKDILCERCKLFNQLPHSVFCYWCLPKEQREAKERAQKDKEATNDKVD